jgi:ABC-type polysaccharide/polyol phosphate export permease
MWTALALQDIKLRYRGSVLGPFWVTINTLMMVAGMSLIYSQLFNIDKNTYLPYLTIGLVVWQFISGVITDSCDTFVRAEGTIKQTPVPFSVYAYRGTCRNLLILAHSLPVVPLAWAVFGVHVDWYVIEIVPALVILAINGCWLGILLGMISARFRDVPLVVASALQAAFLLTPVFWPLQALHGWQWLVCFNPLFAAVDVMRAPLLCMTANEASWGVILATTVFGCVLTFSFFARFRSRIAYWV